MMDNEVSRIIKGEGILVMSTMFEFSITIFNN